MKLKNIIRKIVDMVMLILLILLMSVMLTGQRIHEWIGLIMIIFFVVHHVLNFAWIKKIFKGKYTHVRIFMTVINLLLCVDMFGLAISGIVMSGFVFDFLPIQGRMVLARRVHMLSSYWGVILMSVHLGIHGNQILGVVKKIMPLKKDNVLRKWALRIVATLISGYGIYAFIEQKILGYLLLRNDFIYFDFEKLPILFISECIAIVALFTTTTYYLKKIMVSHGKCF